MRQCVNGIIALKHYRIVALQKYNIITENGFSSMSIIHLSKKSCLF